MVDALSRERQVDPSLVKFRDDLYRKYGIYFPDKKFYQLKAKLSKRLRALSLATIEDYDKYLRENPAEVSDFLDVISTNTTRYYREPKHWKFLEEELIPKWRRKRKIAAWSAACSSGEEPYTLALLLERARESGARFDYKILATDLSEMVLRKGLMATYTRQDLEPLYHARPELVDEYFNSSVGGKLKLADEVREKVVFRKFNLKSDNYPYRSKFDLVLIRNVLIYFDNKMTTHVIENLSGALKRGGHLFTGHSESINSIEHNLDKIQPSVFKK